MRRLRLDEIGYWSEVKLDIVREYAAAYSRLLAAQTTPPLHHLYVDAFAGAGYHISKTTGGFVPGSPLNALSVAPPFREYHFIDLDAQKVDSLRKLTSGRDNVWLYPGDCNRVLLDQILPRCRYREYRRALWLLDPYGLDLNWSVMEAAGREQSIEIFLNFPVMDMNRNVLWRDHSGVSEEDRARMTSFWGDHSWRQVAYATRASLFGDEEEKTTNTAVVEAFRERLRTSAGFSYISEALPMRNRARAIVYYLIFASQKPVALSIVRDIFNKYRNREAAP